MRALNKLMGLPGRLWGAVTRRLFPESFQQWLAVTPVWHKFLLPHVLQSRWVPDPPCGVDPSFEPELVELLTRVVKPGWVCADVGGYIGRMSAVMATLVGPTGHVIVFEPHPNNAGIIRRHMRALGFGPRVRVETLAINAGERNREWLYMNHNNDYSQFSIGVSALRNLKVLRARATSLDHYFPPKSRIDLIKMDIEGGEVLAVRGMRRLLQEQKPAILIELHGQDAALQVRQELLTYGYELNEINVSYREKRTRHILHRFAVHPTRKEHYAAAKKPKLSREWLPPAEFPFKTSRFALWRAHPDDFASGDPDVAPKGGQSAATSSPAPQEETSARARVSRADRK